MFEYQMLPVPAAAKKVKGLKTPADRLAHTLTEAFNEQAKSGWEFVGQESFAIEEKSGLMGKAKDSTITYLVFRRKIETDAMPLDMKLQHLKAQRASTIVQPAMAAAAVATPVAAPVALTPPAEPESPYPAPEPMPAFQEPFPEPMQSPQTMSSSYGGMAHQAEELGQKAATERSFDPLMTASAIGDAPDFGPALKV